MNIWTGFLFLGLMVLFTGGMVHTVLGIRARSAQQDPSQSA
ncbi:hypothetical protein [Deinococcus misasensis]|nr:hypothetical protein [Deinococcus misasensis]